MSELQKPSVNAAKKIPGIWFVPIIALLIGLWMTYQHYSSLGPKVYIEFKNADGLEAGKTKIKSLYVDVGTVESITIKENLEGVIVVAQLQKEAESLLHEDSQFWIVRPRITSGGVSGLGTLLSGAYIELTPGDDKTDKRRKKEFKGLDSIPKTPSDAPGLHFTLNSTESVSVSFGDPIIFRGYEVGRVESVVLDTETRKMVIECYIKPPFNALVNENSKFWNASGILFDASAAGFEVRTESLTTILRGGIAFDLPLNAKPGGPVENHVVFNLYPDKESINLKTYKYHKDYILLFKSSVSGLEIDAPVTYRGIQIGTVKRVAFESYNEMLSLGHDGQAVSIPVVIQIEPGRFTGRDTQDAIDYMDNIIKKRVVHGMRASIKLANLLTGKKMIAIDYYPDAQPVKMETVEGMLVIPTINSDVDAITRQVSEITSKLSKVQFEKISNDTDRMLQKISATADSANKAIIELNNILSSENTQHIPEALDDSLIQLKEVLEGFSPDTDLYRDLNNSIEQLNETLRNLQGVTHTIDSKPNSLIFSKPRPADIQPEVSK